MKNYLKIFSTLLIFAAVLAQGADVKVKYLPPDRTAFEQYCNSNGAPYLGATVAKTACTCAYEKVAQNPARYAEILQSDDPQQQVFVGYEFLAACIPQRFNDEMEGALSDVCVANGLPKTVCPCIARYIRNEYPVKQFLDIVLYDKAQTATILATYSAKCMLFN